MPAFLLNKIKFFNIEDALESIKKIRKLMCNLFDQVCP